MNSQLQHNQKENIIIQPLEEVFSVCKVKDYSGVEVGQKYCFTGCTDEENSLVCPVENVPDNTTERDDGWKCFRIKGVLEFSLIGILARISKIMASNGIGIFAISTFNTDYFLVKEKDFKNALSFLKSSGYKIEGEVQLKNGKTDS